MHYDKLEKQKRIVVKEKKSNIGFLTMGVLFFVPCLWLTFCDLRGLLIAWIPLVLILVSVKWIAENNRLLKQVSSLVKNHAIHKTCEITLDHPKIAFMMQPGTHSRNSVSKTVCAITFRDNSKKKYYYFFDECVTIRYTSAESKKIQDKFWQELHIQCYLNTTIIRTVENDPRYFRTVFGSSYESIFD